VGWWVVSRQPTVRLTCSWPGPTAEAYDQGVGTIQAPNMKGSVMADKSPRQTMSKKSGKSLKQKRADKRAKAQHSSSTTDVLHIQKH
jgi:hypothetical protein